jgi:hypothetical protein
MSQENALVFLDLKALSKPSACSGSKSRRANRRPARELELQDHETTQIAQEHNRPPDRVHKKKIGILNAPADQVQSSADAAAA